jgi:hypothetical protein
MKRLLLARHAIHDQGGSRNDMAAWRWSIEIHSKRKGRGSEDADGAEALRNREKMKSSRKGTKILNQSGTQKLRKRPFKIAAFS